MVSLLVLKSMMIYLSCILLFDFRRVSLLDLFCVMKSLIKSSLIGGLALLSEIMVKDTFFLIYDNNSKVL